MKHTNVEHERDLSPGALPIRWKSGDTDSWPNLRAENREQSELLTAPYLSALVINKTSELLGLCLMMTVLCLAHHPSILITPLSSTLPELMRYDNVFF